MMSLVGLLIARQVCPLCTDPPFSLLLHLVPPGEAYALGRWVR